MRNPPVRFVRTTVSQPFCVMASSGAWNCPPALLTRPSMRACAFRMSATAALTPSSSLYAGKLLGLATDERDRGTEARQLVRGAAPDAAAAAGDDHELPGKQLRPKNRPVAIGASSCFAHLRFASPRARQPSQDSRPVAAPVYA
jgi:hypothetical protein